MIGAGHDAPVVGRARTACSRSVRPGPSPRTVTAPPLVDDRERVEPGEHDVGDRRRLPGRAACHHPLGGVAELERAPPHPEPGREVVEGRRSRRAPDATITSPGSTPTTVERPRRTAATAVAGGNRAIRPGRDGVGTAHRSTVRYRAPTFRRRSRRYHDRTVRSPLAALRALSGRIVLAIVVCALVMGAAVFQINRYIDDEVGEDPARPVDDRAAASSGTNFLIIGSDTRSFVQSEADQEAFTDRDTTVDGPARSDTMMVLHADGEDSYAVSFPRDLLVDVPGLGEQKINAAFNKGPQLVIDTLKAELRRRRSSTTSR